MSMEELAGIHGNKMRPGCRVEIDGVIHVVWRRLSTGPNWKTFCELKFRGADHVPIPFEDKTRASCLLCLVELEDD